MIRARRDRGNDEVNLGRDVYLLVRENGVIEIIGIVGVCSCKPPSNVWKDGCRMIRDGSESEIVYWSSLIGCEVPI